MATATLHVHPSCASNRNLIERLQAATGMLVVISDGKPKLQFQFATGHVDAIPKHLAGRRYHVTSQPTPIDPNDGGHAA